VELVGADIIARRNTAAAKHHVDGTPQLARRRILGVKLFAPERLTFPLTEGAFLRRFAVQAAEASGVPRAREGEPTAPDAVPYVTLGLATFVVQPAI